MQSTDHSDCVEERRVLEEDSSPASENSFSGPEQKSPIQTDSNELSANDEDGKDSAHKVDYLIIFLYYLIDIIDTDIENERCSMKIFKIKIFKKPLELCYIFW